mgnify:CR=1 FL=1
MNLLQELSSAREQHDALLLLIRSKRAQIDDLVSAAVSAVKSAPAAGTINPAVLSGSSASAISENEPVEVTARLMSDDITRLQELIDALGRLAREQTVIKPAAPLLQAQWLPDISIEPIEVPPGSSPAELLQVALKAKDELQSQAATDAARSAKQLDLLRKKLAKAEAECSTLTTTLQQERSGSVGQIAVLRQHLADSNARVLELEKAIAAAEVEIESQKRSVDDMFAARLSASGASSSSSTPSWAVNDKDNAADASEVVHALKDQASDLQGRLTAAESSRLLTEDANAALRAQLHDVQTQLKLQEDKAGGASDGQKEDGDLQRAHDALQREVARVEAMMLAHQQLSEQLAGVRADRDQLQRELHTAQTELSAAQGQVAVLQQRVAQLADEMAHLRQATADRIKSAVLEAKQQVADASQEQLATSRATASELKGTPFLESQVSLADALARVEKLGSQLSAAKIQLTEERSRLHAEYQSELQAQQQERAALASVLHETQQSLAAAQVEQAQLKAQLEAQALQPQYAAAAGMATSTSTLEFPINSDADGTVTGGTSAYRDVASASSAALALRERVQELVNDVQQLTARLHQAEAASERSSAEVMYLFPDYTIARLSHVLTLCVYGIARLKKLSCG